MFIIFIMKNKIKNVLSKFGDIDRTLTKCLNLSYFVYSELLKLLILSSSTKQSAPLTSQELIYGIFSCKVCWCIIIKYQWLYL